MKGVWHILHLVNFDPDVHAFVSVLSMFQMSTATLVSLSVLQKTLHLSTCAGQHVKTVTEGFSSTMRGIV